MGEDAMWRKCIENVKCDSVCVQCLVSGLEKSQE